MKKQDSKQVKDVEVVSKKTSRTFRLVIRGKAEDLSVFQIPIKYLYFNIENGRYADRLIKLRSDSPKDTIDPRNSKWRDEIKAMLLGTSRHVDKAFGDKVAAERLAEDIKGRDQLTPGVVARDGGVLDGNRRLAVLMLLSKEHFDGVILPPDISIEDKWRIEAGLQLGKPIVHNYSTVNELLKVREGLELFRTLKKEGRDPAPGKTPEQMVADAIYGRDASEIKEWIARIELMEQYLAFLGKSGRYDLIGDRSERFLEARKVIIAAKNRGWKPDEMGKLRAWLFHQIQEKNLDNWELRQIYKAIGGDPNSRGKKLSASANSVNMLVKGIPSQKELQETCREIAKHHDDTTVVPGERETKKVPKLNKQAEKIRAKSLNLGDGILTSHKKEQKMQLPIRKLEVARDNLSEVRERIEDVKVSGKINKAMNVLERIEELARDCKRSLHRKG